LYSWRGNPNLSGSSDRDYLSQIILHLTDEISRSDSPADQYFLRGNAYLDAGGFGEATRDYSSALELEPLNAVYHNNLGIALRYMERFDEAISVYDRALELDPKYRDAYTNRGVALADRGDLEMAVSDFGRAIAIDPEFWFAISQRGLALWALGRRAEAEADYERVRELRS
jgi:Flp pilus assembly protein TadD